MKNLYLNKKRALRIFKRSFKLTNQPKNHIEVKNTSTKI